MKGTNKEGAILQTGATCRVGGAHGVFLFLRDFEGAIRSFFEKLVRCLEDDRSPEVYRHVRGEFPGIIFYKKNAKAVARASKWMKTHEQFQVLTHTGAAFWVLLGLDFDPFLDPILIHF